MSTLVSAAPDILLRADVEQPDLELVSGDDTEDPGARHVGFRNRELHVEEHLRIHLVAAPALRLQDPEEARILEVLHGCGGEGGGLARRGQPLAQRRFHRARAVDELFPCREPRVGHGTGCLRHGDPSSRTGSEYCRADRGWQQNSYKI